MLSRNFVATQTRLIFGLYGSIFYVGDGALLDGQDLIRNVVDDGEVGIIESRLLRWTIKPASERYKVRYYHRYLTYLDSR
jgi:hypothetical protein